MTSLSCINCEESFLSEAEQAAHRRTEHGYQLTTAEWLLLDDNAHNMGRFGYLTGESSHDSGRTVWDRAAEALVDHPDKWQAFVNGWNEAFHEVKAGRAVR